jgi:hypothetical protein
MRNTGTYQHDGLSAHRLNILQPTNAVITWLVASKKKNCVLLDVFKETRLISHLRYNEGLDKHDYAARDHGGQSNDIHGTKDIEDDIAWTRKLFD